MTGTPSRRAMLAGAALGGALAAQGAAAAEETVWSAEYWAEKGPVKLYLFRKRLGAPRPGEAPRPVLFLVHGSSNSGVRPST